MLLTLDATLETQGHWVSGGWFYICIFGWIHNTHPVSLLYQGQAKGYNKTSTLAVLMETLGHWVERCTQSPSSIKGKGL